MFRRSTVPNPPIVIRSSAVVGGVEPLLRRGCPWKVFVLPDSTLFAAPDSLLVVGPTGEKRSVVLGGLNAARRDGNRHQCQPTNSSMPAAFEKEVWGRVAQSVGNLGSVRPIVGSSLAAPRKESRIPSGDREDSSRVEWLLFAVDRPNLSHSNSYLAVVLRPAYGKGVNQCSRHVRSLEPIELN